MLPSPGPRARPGALFAASARKRVLRLGGGPSRRRASCTKFPDTDKSPEKNGELLLRSLGVGDPTGGGDGMSGGGGPTGCADAMGGGDPTGAGDVMGCG